MKYIKKDYSKCKGYPMGSLFVCWFIIFRLINNSYLVFYN